MAQQQQLIIAEFVEKVKRDNYRKDDPFFLDDDSPITRNRGNKLNRNAKLVQQGRLNSNALFRQTIEHAGYTRDVISRNPQYYTPEGDIVEDEEDIDDDDELLDENIYKDIKLEDILAPLASAADLPIHPSMSYPYKERGLEEMIKHAEEQLHTQQQILYEIKNIYTGFLGDVGFAPMGLFRDAEAIRILAGAGPDEAGSAADGSVLAETEMPSTAAHLSRDQTADTQVMDGASIDADMTDRTEQPLPVTNGNSNGHDDAVESIERMDHAGAVLQRNGEHSGQSEALANGVTPAQNGLQPIQAAQSDTGAMVDGSNESGTADDADSNTPSHRMTTRRQANHTTRTPSPIRSISPVSNAAAIDPFFSMPAEAIPDATQGLPSQMADETRLALSTYISKQEEVVRQLQELHSGLLRALKMRQDVWKWTKAEGHVGEMSDNEDWVDLEEWGIDPKDGRIKYTKGQQEEDQVDEEEERRAKRVRRAGRAKE